ncbi:hypothetical protein [Thomasclavelia saccharogumia]|uniref:hypothetical protein n=1 Tax=Thomasclavelia saccharogumia TaxID=341225 RepID=UPI000479ABED|nr:hypothetical protein [Thomasclavelia saccharogumia]
MKKFLNILLTVIMVGVTIILCVNLSIRTMSTKTVTNAVVVQEASTGIKEILNSTFPDVSNETIDKVEDVIKNNDTLNNVTGDLLDQITESINNGREVKTDEILSQLSDALDKSIPEIEEAIGKEIPQEQIDKIQTKLADEDSTLQNKIKSTVEKIQTATPGTKQFIKTYSTLSDTFTRVACIISLIVIIVLLGVVNKSYFKWTLYSGISSLSSGIIIGLFLPLVVNAMEFTIGMRVLGMSIDIPVDSLHFSGLICGVIGVVLIIVYMILKRKYPTYDRNYY